MKQKPFKFFTLIGDENGSAIIIALMVLLALSIIGIATITTSRFETQVATNDILSKKAFYSADGGIEIARDLIEENLSCAMGFAGAPGITPNLTHLPFEQRENFLRVTDLDFAYQATADVIADVDPVANGGDGDGILDPDEVQPSDNNKDIWFGDNSYTLGDYDDNGDGEIDPTFGSPPTDNLTLPHTSIVAFGDTTLSIGAAIQMAAGYEGIGYGTAGGGARIVYQIHSRHQNQLRNSISYIMVRYRHFIGQEGNCQF